MGEEGEPRGLTGADGGRGEQIEEVTPHLVREDGVEDIDIDRRGVVGGDAGVVGVGPGEGQIRRGRELLPVWCGRSLVLMGDENGVVAAQGELVRGVGHLCCASGNTIGSRTQSISITGNVSGDRSAALYSSR